MVNRKLGNFLKKSKKIWLGVIGLFGLLFVLPFFIPTASYLAQFEHQASEILGVPVKINSAHIFFMPTPRIRIDGIVVGDAKQATVQSLTVIPTIRTIFSNTRVIQLTIDQPVFKESALPILTQFMNKPPSSAKPSVIVTAIDIHKLTLDWPKRKLPILDAEMRFDNDMQFLNASITTEGGQIEAEITPHEAGQAIVVKLQNWLLPLEKPWQVEQGRLDMMLHGSHLDISKFTLAMYGGTINGNATLDWQRQWKLNGQLHIKEVSLKTPTSMISVSTYLGGRLMANGRFAATASNAEALMNQLRAEFTFTVTQGVLYGMDLVKVASLLIKQNVAGGETQFDTFTGQLAISGKRYHLKRLNVSSGLLSAKGDVSINAQEKLDGSGEVALKQSVGLVSVPVIVSGTVNQPVVLPSKAALAGAALGTAVLGPGLGTSLGSKAGSAMSGLKDLFGGD
ncbi:uncharacterized protein involved in outer membrane biogenesis [Methylophilaceae bacterium 11]|nr:uncharacterized protein involved in outer membrane biogenesis [Methylophilaceae bacterium 11]